MPVDLQPLFSADYLLSRWATEFEIWRTSDKDEELRERLALWDERRGALTETQVEHAFLQQFFVETWGFWPTGTRRAADGFCMVAKLGVADAGQAGGKGAADLALGWFGRPDVPEVPQALCEFKDIRSALDAPQARKGNTRSPVQQCFDYLRHAFDRTDARSPVMPTWGIATDMNEFRLYARREGQTRAQRFVIHPLHGDPAVPLAAESDEARVQRFLFARLFHRDLLLATTGKSPLERLLDDQFVQEQTVEATFYREYAAWRQVLFEALLASNPAWAAHKGRLVGLAQRILDRLLFVLFCEDMGPALLFPPDLLRDVLVRESTDPFYNPEDDRPWQRIRSIFGAMRDGTRFGPHTIPLFNGGLFADDPDIDALRVPTRVLCARGQGADRDALVAHPNTLLYISARYNFGVSGAGRERTIGLVTLGRIFEQSITDLELMEAEAEGREPLVEMSRRKRKGVYYTPEWVTGYLVQETVGARLADLRRETGLADAGPVSDEDAATWRAPPRRRQYRRVTRYVQALDAYAHALEAITVLDPACGSGAFLIQALAFLTRERKWVAEERFRIHRTGRLFDVDATIRDVLARNLYGVDISPESVEITRLALWLHTAVPGQPLTTLDRNIRCGNSLVGPDFADFFQRRQGDLFERASEEERDRVNVFDWRAAFPEVFERGGFDCVVGNPPYVKLQNFRKVEPRVAEYLVQARRPDGAPRFESTQTGNFDLYLPFIEQGIDLLNPAGRMGFIAQTAWVTNEYGAGLRRKVRRIQRLDRWVDFRGFQVFAGVTTYTALQFYAGSPRDEVRYVLRPDGDVSSVDWDRGADTVRTEDLAVDAAWSFQPLAERNLIERLRRTCDTLGSVTEQIFQGLITSADQVYHLERVGPGRYRSRRDGAVHEVEDTIMRPLVSGTDAKRYQVPATTTYLLFPYDLAGPRPRLFTADEMAAHLPRAWAYLRAFEAELRGRERHSFDDEQWYRFGRNQNLDKQERPKLGVAETVPALRLFADPDGRFFFNNVRVNGILTRSDGDLWYLLGVLNSPVADFVFRRTAKVIEVGKYEANKQFIAPLPVPRCTDAEKADVAARAERLQALHSARRDAVAAIAHRLESAQALDDARPASWLWADVRSVDAWKAANPLGLEGRALTVWAREKFDTLVTERQEALAEALAPARTLSVDAVHGELRLLADGTPVFDGVFVPEPEAPFLAAQWRQALRLLPAAEAPDARRLVRALLALRRTDNAALRDQVVALDADIARLDADIAIAEYEMNDLVYRLYALTPEEREMVERG